MAKSKSFQITPRRAYASIGHKCDASARTGRNRPENGLTVEAASHGPLPRLNGSTVPSRGYSGPNPRPACHAEGRGFECHHPLLKPPETGGFCLARASSEGAVSGRLLTATPRFENSFKRGRAMLDAARRAGRKLR